MRKHYELYVRQVAYEEKDFDSGVGVGNSFSNVTIGTAGKDMPAGGDTFSVQEKLPVKFTQYFSDRAGKDAEAASEKMLFLQGRQMN